MPGCAAFGCSNRSEQGFKLKVFPRDATRRKLWASKVKRVNWEPTKTSYLCDVHFEEDQWEVAPRGGKRLKPGAVPTIFSHTPLQQKRKPPKDREQPVMPSSSSAVTSVKSELSSELEKENNTLFSHTPVQLKQEPTSDGEVTRPMMMMTFLPSSAVVTSSLSSAVKSLPPAVVSSSSSPVVTSVKSELSSEPEKGNHTLFALQVKQEPTSDIEVASPRPVMMMLIPSSAVKSSSAEAVKLEKSELSSSQTMMRPLLPSPAVTSSSPAVKSSSAAVKTSLSVKSEKELSTELEKAKVEIKKLWFVNLQLSKRLNIKKNENYRLKLKLKNSMPYIDIFNEDQIQALGHKAPRWSDKTMKTALDLKSACGNRGYKALLANKLPYPSIRSLQRWVVAKGAQPAVREASTCEPSTDASLQDKNVLSSSYGYCLNSLQ